MDIIHTEKNPYKEQIEVRQVTYAGIVPVEEDEYGTAYDHSRILVHGCCQHVNAIASIGDLFLDGHNEIEDKT